MRRSLWLVGIIVLSLALAGPALAQGKGGGGGGGGGEAGGGGGGGGGGAPPPPPQQEAPPGNSGSAPGHDPNGAGNSENAPGHEANGPGNSDVAHAQPPAEADADVDEPEPPSDGAATNETTERVREERDTGRPAEQGGGRANASGASEERGRGRNDTGRPDAPPGLDDNRTRGPSDRALERRSDRANESSGEGRGRGNGNALGDGRGASGGEVPAAALQESSVADRAQERVAAVHVRREQREVDVARGDVHVQGLGVEDPARAILVIVHPNGTEELLAAGTTEAAWNTSAYENGYYTVEVRERASSGSGTVTVATTRVLVENPRAAPVAVVAAVATGAAVSAGAGALTARGIDLLGVLRGAAGEAAGETASRAAEERLRARTAEVARVDWTRRSILLLLAAGAMLAFFKVFADRGDLLLALPIAFLAAFVYTVGDYGAEWMIARSSGAQARFRIWAPGAISLAVSSLLFRAPFGYPGYVSETDVGTPAQRGVMVQKAGIRALVFMGVGIALTLPFLLVGSLWRWELAEYGVGLALMMGAAGAMPFSPMPGKDVWVWSKVAWACITGTLVALYILWQLALLPIVVLIGAGFVGGVAFVVGLRALRPERA